MDQVNNNTTPPRCPTTRCPPLALLPLLYSISTSSYMSFSFLPRLEFTSLVSSSASSSSFMTVSFPSLRQSLLLSRSHLSLNLQFFLYVVNSPLLASLVCLSYSAFNSPFITFSVISLRQALIRPFLPFTQCLALRIIRFPAQPLTRLPCIPSYLAASF